MVNSISWLRRALAVCGMLLVAACGGGGSDAGTPPFGGGGGTTPPPTTPVFAAALDVVAPPTILNTGTQTASVVVTALNASNVALAGATVAVSADQGGILTPLDTSTVTDASGQLRYTLSIGSDRSNRTITVTATSGSVTKTAAVAVVTSPEAAQPASIEIIASATTVGTGGDQVTISAFVKDATNNTLPGTAVSFTATSGTLSDVSAVTSGSGVAVAKFAAGANKLNRDAVVEVIAGTVKNTITLPIVGTKLTASGPSALILGGDSAAYTITAVDSRGNAISGIPIAGASLLGNPVTPDGSNVTNANGQTQFSFSAQVAGDDKIRFFAATSATLSADVGVSISGVDFEFTLPAKTDPPTTAVVNVDSLQRLQVRFREGGQGKDGISITFAATGGTLSDTAGVPGTEPSFKVDTANGGLASVYLQSSFAGPVTVQASATVGGKVTSTSLPLAIVATTPSKLVLQITPSALPPNAVGSETSRAQVVAKVTDANGNPVAGKVVNFSRDADPSGGNLGQPSAVTDANGEASVSYIAGAESTASNGVQLRATVAGTAVAGTAPLTVNQRALFITLGTGNVIGNLDPQTYQKDWVVYVTDANGIAVSGVTLTMKVLPLYYRRGHLVYIDPSWVYAGVLPAPNADPVFFQDCRNEDLHYFDEAAVEQDIRVSNGILDAGEDRNGDRVLTPGNVVSVTPGTVQTDASGRATVSLIYGENFAPWVEVRLTASAVVAGTESRRDAEFVLNGSAEDFSKEDTPPAGAVSPFGMFDAAQTSIRPGNTAAACVNR